MLNPNVGVYSHLIATHACLKSTNVSCACCKAKNIRLYNHTVIKKTIIKLFKEKIIIIKINSLDLPGFELTFSGFEDNEGLFESLLNPLAIWAY